MISVGSILRNKNIYINKYGKVPKQNNKLKPQEAKLYFMSTGICEA
jgi:hypothetical protein